MFNDQSLRVGLGFKGEGRKNNSVIIVKTHKSREDPADMVRWYNMTVNVVRNPFQAIAAERKRLVAVRGSHTSNPGWSQIVFGKESVGDRWHMTSSMHWDNWTSLAADKLLRTDVYLHRLIDAGMPVHTIRFEDLQRDTQGVMAGALQFIGESRCS